MSISTVGIIKILQRFNDNRTKFWELVRFRGGRDATRTVITIQYVAQSLSQRVSIPDRHHSLGVKMS